MMARGFQSSQISDLDSTAGSRPRSSVMLGETVVREPPTNTTIGLGSLSSFERIDPFGIPQRYRSSPIRAEKYDTNAPRQPLAAQTRISTTQHPHHSSHSISLLQRRLRPRLSRPRQKFIRPLLHPHLPLHLQNLLLLTKRQRPWHTQQKRTRANHPQCLSTQAQTPRYP